MAVLTCPKCQGRMKFPDKSNAPQVRCPTCAHLFATGRGTRDPDEEAKAKAEALRAGRRRADEEDEEDRRDARAEREERKRVEAEEEERAEQNLLYYRASIGALLNFIAGWVLVGAMVFMVVIHVLNWCGLGEGIQVISMLAGLIGLVCWLTMSAGTAFFIGGPPDRGAYGLSIAATGAAGLHIALLLICANDPKSIDFSGWLVEAKKGMEWENCLTQTKAFPILTYTHLATQGGDRNANQGAVFPILTNIVELARMVLYLLMLRAVMLGAEKNYGAAQCMRYLVVYSVVVGGLFLVGLIFGAMLQAMRPDPNAADYRETFVAVSNGLVMVLYAVMIGMTIWCILLTRLVRDGIDSRRS